MPERVFGEVRSVSEASVLGGSAHTGVTVLSTEVELKTIANDVSADESTESRIVEPISSILVELLSDLLVDLEECELRGVAILIFSNALLDSSDLKLE